MDPTSVVASFLAISEGDKTRETVILKWEMIIMIAFAVAQKRKEHLIYARLIALLDCFRSFCERSQVRFGNGSINP